MNGKGSRRSPAAKPGVYAERFASINWHRTERPSGKPAPLPACEICARPNADHVNGEVCPACVRRSKEES